MVDIIPKPIKKLPQWQNILFYFVVVSPLAAILTYALLFYLENKSLSELQNIEEQIAKVGTSEEKILEREILDDKKKISDFSTLLSSRQKSLNFFEFLEKTVHPKAWFSGLELYPQTSKATIAGKAEDFKVLDQQLLILRAEDLIENIALSELSIAKDGETQFILELSFDPQMLK